jgi:tRNA(fMet)-specific endonuclease VapC
LRYLLDTSIVSAPISKKPDAAIVRRLTQHGPECAVAAPVWHELIYGCRRMPAGKRRTSVEAYLRDVVHTSFSVLPYDEAAARWHGEERARLEALGRPAPFVDGQIAAIAHANGLILVTTNTKDFRGFKELTVENWSRRRARLKPDAAELL